MTNRQAQPKSSTRRTRTAGLCWPNILLGFADWLLESGWAEDSLGAYSVAFALDRSTRERRYFGDGKTLPLGIFETEEYNEFLYGDCGHSPWNGNEVVAAIGLFAMFAAATNVSPTQHEKISAFAEVMEPNSPRPATPVRARSSTRFGQLALTTHIQKLAEWSMTHEHVPAPCPDHADDAMEVVRALGIHLREDCGDLPGAIDYHVVVDAAWGVGVLQGNRHELTTGPTAAAWLESPTTDQLYESVVAAYQSCLTPVVDRSDESLMLNVAVASTLTTTMLIRSLVDDPFRSSDGVYVGKSFSGEVVAAFSKLRLVSMIDLGLMVAVNNRFCIPDVLAPCLIEALDRDRRKRHAHG